MFNDTTTIRLFNEYITPAYMKLQLEEMEVRTQILARIRKDAEEMVKRLEQKAMIKRAKDYQGCWLLR